MVRFGLALLVLGFVIGGCVGASSADQHSKAEEFSEAGFEAEMKKSGKAKEFEDAKKREADYLAAGRDSSASADGSPTSEGPTNAGNQ